VSGTAHVVLAHPEPQSYNGHLARVAADTLAAQGFSVTCSDLYAMGFDPCERAEHFESRHDPSRFDAQAEQHHASSHGRIPAMVRDEIARLDGADLLVLQYPMWWHLPPAMLKGWMDRVFIYGEVYASRKRFENGRFTGKRAMLSLTVATNPDTYAFNGRSGDIDLLLWPVQFSLAYVGYTVLSPFVAYGVESGLRYSDAAVLEARLEGVSEAFRQALIDIDRRSVIPFNRMAEWQPSGRISADAPVYSPFIRQRRGLDLT
jgi:NAD(P)H dehydrogenase (quinone)